MAYLRDILKPILEQQLKSDIILIIHIILFSLQLSRKEKSNALHSFTAAGCNIYIQPPFLEKLETLQKTWKSFVYMASHPHFPRNIKSYQK